MRLESRDEFSGVGLETTVLGSYILVSRKRGASLKGHCTSQLNYILEKGPHRENAVV